MTYEVHSVSAQQHSVSLLRKEVHTCKLKEKFTHGVRHPSVQMSSPRVMVTSTPLAGRMARWELGLCTHRGPAKLASPSNTSRSANHITKLPLRAPNTPPTHPLVSAATSKNTAGPPSSPSHTGHLPTPTSACGSYQSFPTETARLIFSKLKTGHFSSLLKPLSGLLNPGRADNHRAQPHLSPPCPPHPSMQGEPYASIPFTAPFTLQAQPPSSAFLEPYRRRGFPVTLPETSYAFV